MAKATKNTVEEIITKTDTVVENVEVAPEADAIASAVETVAAESETEKAAMPKTDEENAAEDAKDSTEKAAKPMTDEETAAEDAAEPADAEATEAKKPVASKSDEVIAEAVTEINDGLEKAFSDLVETVKSLQAEVEMLKSSKVDIDTAKSSFEAVAKDIASAKSEFNKFGKRVELVEQDTAFRKSGDLGEIVQDQPEMVEKSLWAVVSSKQPIYFKTIKITRR